MPAPILSPAGPLTRDGLTWSVDTYIATEQLVQVTNGEDVEWEASGGTLSDEEPQEVLWTIPNRTGVWTLSSDNGVDAPVILQVTVIGMLPRYWDWRVPATIDQNVLVFKPYDGPKVFLEKGDKQYKYEMGSEDVSYEQWQELRDFWEWHHPGRKFKVDDPAAARAVSLYETDSAFNWRANSPDSYQFSFRIEEAWPYGG